MAKSLDDLMKQIPPERKAKIEQRSQEIIEHRKGVEEAAQEVRRSDSASRKSE